MDNSFTFSANALLLDKAFRDQGFNLVLVGGAVRDFVIGVEPKDFDFTTDATPGEQIAVFEAAGFRYVPTGLKHGTLTAIVNDELFEVTTMRTESEHDGRYATMTFTRDLNEDLGRRDLTINAMAMTMTGEIVDPFGGRDDLANRHIRFVGDPDQRIREDYLRILRWVRFHQRFANGHPFDPETLRAVERNALGLCQISVERVWSELSKALTYDHADDMLDMLQETGIAHHIGMAKGHSASVYMLFDRTRDPVTRLSAYYRGTRVLESLSENWKWSGEERKLAADLTRLSDPFGLAIEDEWVQRYLVAMGDYPTRSVAEAARMRNCSTDIENWIVPNFPNVGNLLISKGMKPGPEMGQTIRNLRKRWAESDYRLTAAELVADAF